MPKRMIRHTGISTHNSKAKWSLYPKLYYITAVKIYLADICTLWAPSCLVSWHLITRQLNTWTFNHATINHRPVTGCTLPSLPYWNVTSGISEAGAGCIARTNAVEGWPYGLQALFQCHHPTLWTLLLGIEEDLQTAFLQAIADAQPSVPKRYKELNVRVQNTVERYLSSEILVYLRGVASFLILHSIGL